MQENDASGRSSLSDSLTTLALLFLVVIVTIVTFRVFPCTMKFLFAQTPEEVLRKGYPPLPEDWEAGVMDHGKFVQWYTIDNHPLWFLICLTVTIVCIVVGAIAVRKLLSEVPLNENGTH